MKTEELGIVMEEIEDVTTMCNKLANECVKIILDLTDRDGINAALSDKSFRRNLKKLAVCICRFNRARIVDYGMALLTFPLDSFLSKDDYNAAEKFLKTFLGNISGYITPEDILFSVMDNRK